MKFKDLQNLSSEELGKSLREAREELRSTRFAVAASQESKVRKVRVVRQTIARINSLLTSKAR